MTNRLDDIPPPPYSETDIYSTSGGDRSPAVPLSPSHHRRGSHNRDNISRSPTSTVDGEIIYTPPLTPRTGSQPSISGSNFSYAGSNSNSNSFSNYVAPTPNIASVAGDHLTTASAQAYFDTRPAPPPTWTTSNIVCPITVRDDSSPDSFPFPADLFLDKDVTPTDWQTFVNYLIPHFHAENNERVIDRKLRAEGTETNSNDDVISIGTGIRSNTHAEAEAQLDQIRSPLVGSFNSTTQGGGGGGLSESRRQVVEQTVREWNEGFFGPRGVSVRVANTSAEEDVLHVAETTTMPGGWDASFDTTTNANGAEANAAAGAATPGNNNNNPRSRFARFMPQFGGGPHNFGLGIGGGGGPGNTFRLGGIAVDGDRLSIGDRFVADRNGLRIGSFVADNNGISMNGQAMFAGCPPAGPGPGGPGMRGMPGTWGPGGGFGAGGRGGCRDGGGGGGGPWGRGWGGRHRGHGWGGRHGHGSFGPGPCASFGPGSFGAGPGPVQDKHDDEHDHDHGHGHRGRRGRRSERHGRHRSRSGSVDSASSISSSSSSSSESSIGSLPDYDELRDSQLPVARDHLLAWLHDPEQPISKEKLKEFKQKVKEAKNSPTDNTINEPVNLRHDQKAMRKEVKALMKEWKDLKKQQTKLRRQLRRERKQQRRAEKRERRNTKREMKRAAREQKRAARRNGGGGGSSTSLPDVDPRLPRMPGAFSPPNVPGVPGQARQHPWPPNINVGGGPFGNGPNFFSPFNFFGGVRGGVRPPQPSEGTMHRAAAAAAQAPGAWPSGEENGINHVSSQEKYKVADELEAQLIEKETELFKLHEAIALAADADAAASSSSSRGGEPTMSSDARARNEKQILATRDLEMEIEDLAKQMALMRTEADAEYAKELARMA
ncbi:hypothetical protein V8F33_010934 [Rhypophila sp. PSN 637]